MPFLQSVTGGAPHINDFMGQLQTFLLANGWTLFDTVSTTDKVFRSTGTGRERIFVRVTKNVNRIEVRAQQFWNATANTAHNQAGNTGGVSGFDANDAGSFAFWLYTDGRAIIMVAKIGGSYNASYAGAIDRVHDANVGFSSSDVLAGASVVVPLDQSFPAHPDWQPGKKLFILDQDSTHDVAGAIPAEHATVVAVTVSNVTLNLAQNHKAGAMVGVDPQPVMTTLLNVVGSVGRFTNGLVGWNSPSGVSFGSHLPFDAVDADIDPNDRTGRFLVQSIYMVINIVGQAEVRGKLAGVLAPGEGAIGAEDTTDIGGLQYVALPIGNVGRPLLIPMF